MISFCESLLTPISLQSVSVREESNQPAVRVLKNAQGEKYVDLGKKKRATVRSYKGEPLPVSTVTQSTHCG